jgi:hypothetical protein
VDGPPRAKGAGGVGRRVSKNFIRPRTIPLPTLSALFLLSPSPHEVQPHTSIQGIFSEILEEKAASRLQRWMQERMDMGTV